MDDELLEEELKRQGYESYIEYCIKNWDKLTLRQKQVLKAVGVHP